MHSDMLAIDFLDEALLEMQQARSGLAAEEALALDKIETAVKAILLRVEDCQATRLAAEQAQTDAYITARRQAGISMIR